MEGLPFLPGNGFNDPSVSIYIHGVNIIVEFGENIVKTKWRCEVDRQSVTGVQSRSL